MQCPAAPHCPARNQELSSVILRAGLSSLATGCIVKKENWLGFRNLSCSLINADFCCAGSLIAYGALLGKVSPVQTLVFTLFGVTLFAVEEYIILDLLHVSLTDNLIVNSATLEDILYFVLAQNTGPATTEQVQLHTRLECRQDKHLSLSWCASTQLCKLQPQDTSDPTCQIQEILWPTR